MGISRVDLYNYASTYTKPTLNISAHSILIESDTGNIFMFDGVTWRQIGTSGSSHVLLKNTAIITEGVGTGGTINFSAASGEIARLGDVTLYGLPYGDVIVTKTGTAATASFKWGVATGGLLVMDITAINAADALNITAETPNGDVLTNILYRTAAGAISRAAISAATMITLYNGGA